MGSKEHYAYGGRFLRAEVMAGKTATVVIESVEDVDSTGRALSPFSTSRTKNEALSSTTATSTSWPQPSAPAPKIGLMPPSNCEASRCHSKASRLTQSSSRCCRNPRGRKSNRPPTTILKSEQQRPGTAPHKSCSEAADEWDYVVLATASVVPDWAPPQGR